MRRFEAYKAWREKHGKSAVARSGTGISAFEHDARRQRARKMPPERKRLLDAIGFLWESGAPERKERFWNENYERLRDFRSRTGHSNVAPSHDVKLQMWVNHQREARKKGKLSAKEIELLDRLDFKWTFHKKRLLGKS